MPLLRCLCLGLLLPFLGVFAIKAESVCQFILPGLTFGATGGGWGVQGIYGVLCA